MIENRWLLFVIYFVGMMALRLLFFPNSSTPLTEHIIFTLINAALLAYSYKYFKRLLAYLVPKIVLWLLGPKAKDKWSFTIQPLGLSLCGLRRSASSTISTIKILRNATSARNSYQYESFFARFEWRIAETRGQARRGAVIIKQRLHTSILTGNGDNNLWSVLTYFRGGRSNATASCSKCPLWDPSQKGLLADRPHRHKETRVRPCNPYTLPFMSTISKSPSTFVEPLLLIVIFVLLI